VFTSGSTLAESVTTSYEKQEKNNDVISSSDPFDKLAECSFSTSGKSYHLGDWSTGKDLTLMMASALVVETSLANNSPFQDFTHPHDHFQSKNNGTC